jgi:hypothetical protein
MGVTYCPETSVDNDCLDLPHTRKQSMEWRSEVGSCDNGNETSGSVEGGEFLDQPLKWSFPPREGDMRGRTEYVAPLPCIREVWMQIWTRTLDILIPSLFTNKHGDNTPNSMLTQDLT